MALSSGIPTSFVPKQPVQGPARPMSSGNNLFLVIALIVAGITILAALGVFAYERLLTHQLEAKKEQLAQAQAKVNEDSVEEFVRLRDRLTNGKELLDSHVLLSQFLNVLETDTLQNVRFTDLKLEVATDHTAQLIMTGTAKSFNALAAQSNSFASEKRIKRAIFSDITVNDANLVTFSLTADIDSKLVNEGDALPSLAGSSTPAAPTAQTAPVTP